MSGKNCVVRMVGGVAAMVVWFANPAFAQVTFEWNTVSYAANPEDPENSDDIPGIGSVANVYRIAKHEVTNSQYAVFLNAVADTDTNDLYNASMGSDPRGGILRSGSSGSFAYTVKADMGNKPVNFVSVFDSMRFVNWLHNGQPSGTQNASTTEDGVYAVSDGTSETRAVDAQFFIPTENEWYKAAYYQPSATGGDTDGYWLYPTASNTTPTVATANATGDVSNPGTNVANYDLGADWNGQDGNVTTVGSAGVLSESFFGTSDQGGNVWEWTETVAPGPYRVLRGGSWFFTDLDLQSSAFYGFTLPEDEYDDLGFRVASPLPDTDMDGVPDVSDNCPSVANANQSNHDGDAFGDACDQCPFDPTNTKVEGQCIPALSEWGMMAMALLFLIAGTILHGKRAVYP
jgi:formylglycine-generating enzyme required for sulfatase activity